MVDNLEVSGSDARRIMAGEALEVWEEKTGRREPRNLSMFLPAMIGLATEKVSRVYYKYKTGRTVYDPRPTGGVKLDYKVIGEDHLGIKLQSTSYAWMVGHLDGLVEDGTLGVFESKHTSAITDWNPAEAVVERNFWQGAHYCLLTGLTWIDFSCLYGNSEWQTFRVKPTDDQLMVLLGRLSGFHKAVVADTPPPGAEVVIAGPKLDPKRAYSETELRTWPIANSWASEADVIVNTWEIAEQHDKAIDRLKKLELPPDAKLVEGFGIKLGIAKNGAKRITRLEKTPLETAQPARRKS